MNRRTFFHASLMAGGLIAVPQFGRWFPERRRGQVIGTLFYETPFAPIRPVGLFEVRGLDQWGREVSFEFEATQLGPHLLQIPAHAMGKLQTMSPAYLEWASRLGRPRDIQSPLRVVTAP